MAYEKQGFKDGNILYSEQLERIEEGIINAEKAAENAKLVLAVQSETLFFSEGDKL